MEVWQNTLFAVVALLLGAGLTFAAGQWRRHQDERVAEVPFVADKRQAYAEFLTAAQELRTILQRNGEALQNLRELTEHLQQTIDRGLFLVQRDEQKRFKLAESDEANVVKNSQDALRSLQNAVTLSRDRREAHVRWTHACNHLMLFSVPPDILRGMDSLRAAIQDDTNAFYEEYWKFVRLARRDLGLPDLADDFWS